MKPYSETKPSIANLLQLFISLLLSMSLNGYGRTTERSESGETNRYVPTIVTSEIKDGIGKHIAEQVELGNGYFTIPFEGKKLELKLVRVHIEYLASLASPRHFACVDMASANGEFYNIDFFLHGNPGDMTVTETTVHKLNGIPYYVWKQNEDKNWVRAEVDTASKDLLGIRTYLDLFEFRYQATLPVLSHRRDLTLDLGPAAGPITFLA